MLNQEEYVKVLDLRRQGWHLRVIEDVEPIQQRLELVGDVDVDAPDLDERYGFARNNRKPGVQSEPERIAELMTDRPPAPVAAVAGSAGPVRLGSGGWPPPRRLGSCPYFLSGDAGAQVPLARGTVTDTFFLEESLAVRIRSEPKGSQGGLAAGRLRRFRRAAQVCRYQLDLAASGVAALSRHAR